MKVISIDECGRGAGYGPLAIGLTLIEYKNEFNPKVRDEKEEEILNWARRILYPQGERGNCETREKGRLSTLDSKKLTERRRIILHQQYPYPYFVLFKSAQEINERGVGELNHIFTEMIEEGLYRFKSMGVLPDFILCDGNLKVPQGYKYIEVLRGDYKYPSIGMASVVCKVLRDKLLIEMSKLEHPLYDLENNKGYLTPKHLTALTNLGLTPNHRVNFCSKFSS